MGAILAILANPVITRPLAKLIGGLFSRSGDGPPKAKVVSSASALSILALVTGAISTFFPELGLIISEHITPALVMAIAAAVTAIVGYFQKESVA